MLPADAADRLTLADEVHARPAEPLEPPVRASYVAMLIDPADRAKERTLLETLCAQYGIAPPPPEAAHFSAPIGNARLKWERHGEFSAITVLVPGLSPAPFRDPAINVLPHGWLASLPGRTMVAAHAKLIRAPEGALSDALLAEHFAGNIVVGAEVGEGAGLAYTDFRIHADGFSRFLVCTRSFTPRQAGRMLQRLFEIEAYRMMALLALPLARRLSPRASAIEQALGQLTDRLAAEGTDDEALLHELTRLSAEVERERATGQFRFAACTAYSSLVATRVAELRERRLPGMQPIDEFMARRLNPAIATCDSVARRLRDLSERVARVSALLTTRIEIARERQNQELLASMDRRARLQLRLQQTVEGLSVAAITYYAAGLVGYLAKAAKAGGMHIDPDLTVGIAIPVVAIVVLFGLRRVHRSLLSAHSASDGL
jgi:uncharacterized membrane-anchored protein